MILILKFHKEYINVETEIHYLVFIFFIKINLIYSICTGYRWMELFCCVFLFIYKYSPTVSVHPPPPSPPPPPPLCTPPPHPLPPPLPPLPQEKISDELDMYVEQIS